MIELQLTHVPPSYRLPALSGCLVGVGADNNTFNTPGVEKHAFILKEAKHARQIRAKILSHFERAASPTTSIEEKKLLLQFVVVGGGPTGVEFAGQN